MKRLLNSLFAVSYTHLDVYKRQFQTGAGGIPLAVTAFMKEAMIKKGIKEMCIRDRREERRLPPRREGPRRDKGQREERQVGGHLGRRRRCLRERCV